MQQVAILDENKKQQLWKQCPDAKPNNNHLRVHIADGPYVVSRRIINPDSIDEVNDNKFTAEEIDSIINNSLLQRFYLPCKKCGENTIQIRYQRQTNTMKFYSICVKCKTVMDLAQIVEYKDK